MGWNHESIVAFSKSWGLFYLIGLFGVASIYAFWPGNRKRFHRAKHSIIDQDDKPCR